MINYEGRRVKQSPGEKLSYTFDAGQERLIPGDTILTATWAATTGITIDSQSFDTFRANIRLTGGVIGRSYDATCTITTVSGEVFVDTMQVSVVQR